MIGVDWGTSSLRAFRLGPDGSVLDRLEAPRGILTVPAGGFPAALEEIIGPWLDRGERQVLLSGMVGSRQGWIEAPYLPCPADSAELGRSLIPVPFARAEVRLVPGLTCRDADGVPEVMRGEEVQLVGALPQGGSGLACLPGSHSKWARVSAGRIEGFTTHFTGEAFAALRGHTILGRMMRDGLTNGAAFARGVARSGQAGGLLHHLFGVRALGLHHELSEDDAASYLSGLVIGHEVRAALQPGATVWLIGAPALCANYAAAITACGGTPETLDADAAARGLWQIGSPSWN